MKGVLLHILLIAALSPAAFFVYYRFLENPGPVWINLAPPRVANEFLDFQQKALSVLWTGFYSRYCSDVQWHHEGRRVSDNAVVWKFSRDASENEPSDVYTDWEFLAPIPDYLRPGEYRLCFYEEADCNPVRKWKHKQGCVEFEIVDNR